RRVGRKPIRICNPNHDHLSVGCIQMPGYHGPVASIVSRPAHNGNMTAHGNSGHQPAGGGAACVLHKDERGDAVGFACESIELAELFTRKGFHQSCDSLCCEKASATPGIVALYYLPIIESLTVGFGPIPSS